MDIINEISMYIACNSDLIKAVVLKNLNDKNKSIVMSLFNICLERGIFPTIWKIGKVKIVTKPGNVDKTHYKSHRPITLLSVLGKWFEKIVLKRLQCISLQNNWISEKTVWLCSWQILRRCISKYS
jgi:hypothetical protein